MAMSVVAATGVAAQARVENVVTVQVTAAPVAVAWVVVVGKGYAEVSAADLRGSQVVVEGPPAVVAAFRNGASSWCFRSGPRHNSRTVVPERRVLFVCLVF